PGRGRRGPDGSVRVAGGEGAGGLGWGRLRPSARRDRAVAGQKLAPGTVRRILGFAAPYRRELSIFLLTVVSDALIGVATPILAGRVVNEIAGGHGARAVVGQIALALAGLAGRGSRAAPLPRRHAPPARA